MENNGPDDPDTHARRPLDSAIFVENIRQGSRVEDRPAHRVRSGLKWLIAGVLTRVRPAQ
jgi:hypothetical protein